MASDLRIVHERLDRRACRRCGLATRDAGPREGPALYCDGYTLYAHPPGNAVERMRQQQYAAWIASQVATAPRRVVDVGCGNGSLLLALGERWPGTELMGCDLSIDSLSAARAAGLRLWQGSAASLQSGSADLVIAVNVVEHTARPLDFLRDLRGGCSPD